MKDAEFTDRSAQVPCLTTDEFYSYISGASEGAGRSAIESHLVDCPICREELVALLKSLSPEQAGAFAEQEPPGSETIPELVALVQATARRERGGASRRSFFWRRSIAAAAVIALVGAASWGVKYYSEGARSDRFIEQARNFLEEEYTDLSPSGLRLNLPFRSRAALRSAPPADALGESEALFQRALGVREDAAVAHLGLGYVYLRTSRFSKARAEFQRALQDNPADHRSLLGRGAASYEEALQSQDPFLRDSMLKTALADFDAVLEQNPSSAEARYNRIWALYRAGRHRAALEDIETYLSQESDSIWSNRLRDLQAEISLNNEVSVHEAVEQGATRQDRQRLESIARLVPHRAPEAIRYALKLSTGLWSEGIQAGGVPSSRLRWAAEVLEQAYSRDSGDSSYGALLRFYANLSPAELELKKSADERFEKLANLYRSGDPRAALQLGDGLAADLLRLRDSWQLVHFCQMRGNCFYYLADFNSALGEYLRMLEYANAAGAPDLVAKALGCLVSAQSELRNTEAALSYAQQLQQLAETGGMDYWQGYAARALGILYLDLNQTEKCRREFATALAAAQRLHDADLWINTVEHLGLVQYRSGDLDAARKYYDLALQHHEDFRAGGLLQETAASNSRYASLLWRKGDLSLVSGSLEDAEACFNRGLELSRDTGMKELETRHSLGLVQIRLKRGDLDSAEVELDRSLRDARAGRYEDLLWKADSLRGLLYEKRERPKEALASYQEAVKILETMRRRTGPEELQHSFLANRFDPYAHIVSILYHTRPDKAEAAAYADHAKSMTLMEYLRSEDLSPRLHDNTPGLPNRLSRSLNLLEYFIGPDELFIFLSSHGTLTTAAVPISAGSLKAMVEAFAASIAGNDEAAFSSLARRLYDILMAPVLPAAALAPGEPLVVVPDGPLHRLPFAALSKGKGRHLLEDVTLSYAPSRSVLGYCLGLSRSGAGTAPRSLLLIDGSGNLRGAREEIAGITLIYGERACRINLGDLQARAGVLADAEILHFAGHTRIEGGKPELLLGPEARGIRLGSKTIASWNLAHGRLVNLAGCSTAAGPQLASESPWGLVPALLLAGAPAVLVSQTPVNDLHTRQLNLRFYELLKNPAVGKAEALRQAQLALLNCARADSRQNPISWAPYTLLGDPR